RPGQEAPPARPRQPPAPRRRPPPPPEGPLARDAPRREHGEQGEPRLARRAAATLELRRRGEMALVGAARDDLLDLLDRVADLVVGAEVVRAEAQTRLRAEVAQDPALRELPVDSLERRRADGDDAAAARL